MNKPTLLLELLALAEEPDSPEAWIHLCLKAAEEATAAIAESDLHSPSHIAQAIRHIESAPAYYLTPGHWQTNDLLAVGKAYAEGVLKLDANSSAGAAIAFRANLPPMKSRKMVQSFVACVAVGVLQNFITPRDANVLLYGAQAALSAIPKRKSSPLRKRNQA